MLRAFFVAVAVSVSTLAQAGVNIQHWMTPSGARVYFVETHALPMLDVDVSFAAGSAYDPPGKAGLAGFTQSLLDSGAGDLDEEQIAGRWVDLGARYGGGTDTDHASVSVRTLSSAAERDASLALLRTILTSPKFPVDALERDRANAIASLKEAETKPEFVSSRRFTQALYPNHPYGIVNTTDSLAGITRDDIVNFHKSYYGARNAVITIVGDVTRTDAENIALKLGDGLPAGEVPKPLPAVQLPVRETIRVAHPATQAHIAIGLPAYARGDADAFPLLVGNYVLGGGGFVSRLMNEVREKRGLAYGVQSYFAPRKVAGPFEIGLQTKRAQTAEALKIVDETLTKFLRDGPTTAELKAAKQNLADGFALRLDSNAKLLGFVAMVGFYNLPLTWIDDYPRNVEAVTLDQIRAAFAKYVQPEHLVTVVVAGE